MTRLIRMAVFAAMGTVLFAGAAMAGVPSWAHSTQPDTLGVRIGGYDPGSVDNYLAIKYTIKQVNGNAVQDATVAIDFTGCGDVVICPQTKQTAGTTVQPAAGGIGVAIVSRKTDALGQVTFHVRGHSRGIVPPFSSNPCAQVSLFAPPAQGGGFAGTGNALRIGVFDLDGPPGTAGSLDLSTWLADALVCADNVAPAYRQRSDLNRSGYFVGSPCPGGPGGHIQSLDLSLWLAYALELPYGTGGPATSCAWPDTNP